MSFSGVTGFGGTRSMRKASDGWTLAFIPDPQKLSTNGDGNYDDLIQYVVDQKQARNIKMVLQIGDSVDRGNSNSQWAIADAAMSILDGKLPYLVSIGNHDYDDDKGIVRAATRFDAAYPIASFRNTNHFIDDVYPTNSTHNTAARITVGSYQYLFINIEHLPRTDAIAWANSIATNYGGSADYIIVATHNLLDPSGNREADAELTALWDNFLSQHSKIRLVLCGHVGGTGGVVSRRTDGLVHQHMLNYQTDTGNNFNNSALVRFYHFNQSNHQVAVTTYNPITDTSLTDSQNQFTFSL